MLHVPSNDSLVSLLCCMTSHLVPGRDIVDVHALPARQVAAQRQVHVLHGGPVIPAADVLNAGAPPDAARTCCAERRVVSSQLLGASLRADVTAAHAQWKRGQTVSQRIARNGMKAHH